MNGILSVKATQQSAQQLKRADRYNTTENCLSKSPPETNKQDNNWNLGMFYGQKFFDSGQKSFDSNHSIGSLQDDLIGNIPGYLFTLLFFKTCRCLIFRSLDCLSPGCSKSFSPLSLMMRRFGPFDDMLPKREIVGQYQIKHAISLVLALALMIF